MYPNSGFSMDVYNDVGVPPGVVSCVCMVTALSVPLMPKLLLIRKEQLKVWSEDH